MSFIWRALFWPCSSIKLIFTISETFSVDFRISTSLWIGFLWKCEDSHWWKKNRIHIHIFSTSYIFSMFPVRIAYFNEGIFHSDVIQHVIVVDVFTNAAICTVFSSIVVLSGPMFQSWSWTWSIRFENCSSIFSVLKNLRWGVFFLCCFTIFVYWIGLGT